MILKMKQIFLLIINENVSTALKNIIKKNSEILNKNYIRINHSIM